MALLRDADSGIFELTPLLHDRWSPRAFDPEHELAPDELRLLLEAARWAPSAGNSQPWSFIAGFRGDETFNGIFDCMSAGNQAWAGRTSALVLAAHKVATPVTGYGAYDLGQAAAHLTVQAHALGLHVHQFAGFDHDAATQHFTVPSEWQVLTGIAIGLHGDIALLDEGHAAKEAAPRTRRPLQDFVFSGSWGESAPLG